jgi:hypothetical protein
VEVLQLPALRFFISGEYPATDLSHFVNPSIELDRHLFSASLSIAQLHTTNAQLARDSRYVDSGHSCALTDTSVWWYIYPLLGDDCGRSEYTTAVTE